MVSFSIINWTLQTILSMCGLTFCLKNSHFGPKLSILSWHSWHHLAVHWWASAQCLKNSPSLPFLCSQCPSVKHLPQCLERVAASFPQTDDRRPLTQLSARLFGDFNEPLGHPRDIFEETWISGKGERRIVSKESFRTALITGYLIIKALPKAYTQIMLKSRNAFPL